MQQRSTNTITTTSSQRLRRIFMARAATVIVVVGVLQRSKLHKHRLLYSRRLVPSALCVCVFFPAIVPDVFLTKSTGHRRQDRQKKSCPRTVARGARGLSQIWLEFGDERKTKFQTPLQTGDLTRTEALNMASFTSFFPRNVATSRNFLQTKSVGLLAAPLRHKFVTKTNPWLGSTFLVRNFTKI